MFNVFNRYDQTPGEMNAACKEVKAKLEKKESFLLLDVREQWEWDTARIEGAKLIPLGELKVRAKELNPEEEVIIYCHKGVRGQKGVIILREQGFKNAKNLSGGIEAWSREVDPAVPLY